jgi:1,2-phenylacetyl-CoA epoxidase catalytic subunit
MSSADEHFPFYVCDVKTGSREGFSTLDTAREALLSWVLLQRQAGETVVELPEGQWSDSRVTKWLADENGQVLKLEE